MALPTENRRLIDMTEADLYALIKEILSEERPAPVNSKIVRGRSNIAHALGISKDKLDRLIADGTLKNAIRKNGRVVICDVQKAFLSFNDIWNE